LGRAQTGAKVSNSGQFAKPPVAVPTIGVNASVEAEDVLEGERKLVTALFADIKGSTAYMEDLDPEEARHLIDPALKIMIDAARRYDGYVVQSTGDGIFALFGAPVAHEDHPQRAVLTALRSRSGWDSILERSSCGRSKPAQAKSSTRRSAIP
jgi:class 3 adenylate cyclase